MDLIRRRREMIASAQHEIVFYDYVQSDGLAYINVNRYINVEPPQPSYTLEIVARPDTLNGYVLGCKYYGSNGSEYGSYGCGLYRQSAGRDVKIYAGANYYNFSSYSADSKYTVKYINAESGGRVVGKKDDGAETTVFTGKILNPCVISLFNYASFISSAQTFNNSAVGNCRDNGKIWSIKYYRTDTQEMLMYLRPCTYDGKPGLYDVVRKKFYGNASDSGTLTVGYDNLPA